MHDPFKPPYGLTATTAARTRDAATIKREIARRERRARVMDAGYIALVVLVFCIGGLAAFVYSIDFEPLVRVFWGAPQ